jgi:hypothetical protein
MQGLRDLSLVYPLVNLKATAIAKFMCASFTVIVPSDVSGKYLVAAGSEYEGADDGVGMVLVELLLLMVLV